MDLDDEGVFVVNPGVDEADSGFDYEVPGGGGEYSFGYIFK